MSDITFLEKTTVESLFGMKTGYVLDFSDRTFQEFILAATDRNILDSKYNFNSGSKANRLRAFFKIESNFTVGILLTKLLEFWMSRAQLGEIDYYKEETLYKECLIIANRLKSETLISNYDALKPNSLDKDFASLAKLIKDSIEKNEPELALDRLHTFVIKYIRQLCDNYYLVYSKEDALQNVFGKYVKHIIAQKVIDSEMSIRILKFSISILESFNDIRNNKSFAHDNAILNYNESVLIFNNITNIIKFIEAIEKGFQKSDDNEKVNWTDLPF